MLNIPKSISRVCPVWKVQWALPVWTDAMVLMEIPVYLVQKVSLVVEDQWVLRETWALVVSLAKEVSIRLEPKANEAI